MSPSPSSPSKTNILMSIRPSPMHAIQSRAKTHEFRTYRLPPAARHIWFYTAAPQQRLQFVAEIGGAKHPGEIDDAGIGNGDFNAAGSGYAYEVLHLYELVDPVLGGLSLAGLKEMGFAKGPPQKYQFVKREMLDYFELDKQKKLF